MTVPSNSGSIYRHDVAFRDTTSNETAIGTLQAPSRKNAPSSTRASRFPRRRTQRAGFTLLEVLIATAVTLLMMLSLAQIFKVIGDSMKQGRSVLELNSRLRSVAFQLRSDLENATAIMNPPADHRNGNGYFKYYEGPMNDYTAAAINAAASRLGDADDILMFTARAGDVWYTGKVPSSMLPGGSGTNPVTIAAQHAEVVVFAQPLVSNVDNPTRAMKYRNDVSATPGPFNTAIDFQDADSNGLPDSYRIYYRALLIRPDLDPSSGGVAAVQLAGFPRPLCDMATAHAACDLSLRRESPTSNNVFANSLEDLTKPENRFAHVRIQIGGNRSMPLLALGDRPTAAPAVTNSVFSGSPFVIGSGFLHPAFCLGAVPAFSGRAGEDVIATDVISFDVKGYDPSAPIRVHSTNGTLLTPNDRGFDNSYPNIATSFTTGSRGEFVDLGWGRFSAKYLSAVQSGSESISALCGMQTSSPFVANDISDSLLRSGLVVGSSLTNVEIYQPSYDTWTTHYEGDGTQQHAPSPRIGVVNLATATGTIDAGTDGLDNNNTNGVDDQGEYETTPPFPYPLRGVKVTIRMEDPATRQVKQMSVVREFVSQFTTQ